MKRRNVLSRGRSARRPRRARRSRRIDGGTARRGAETRLRRFRQSSLIAVALTGLLLIVFSPDEAGIAQGLPGAQQADSLPTLPETVSVIQQIPLEELQSRDADTAPVPASDAGEATEEATGALRELWSGFVGNLPKYGIAIGILFVAWLLVRVIRAALRGALARWERADAITALSGVGIWLLAAGVALSVLLGDIRALAGSLGLVGLALSWALQTPIESFTGWLLNSFKGYYRVGDRIAVSDVFGDVYRIDFLNTTVWEYGGSDRPPGSVQAEQPTGRLITFPNNEILTGSVVNYTRDFPFVWDELVVPVASESDLSYALGVLEKVAVSILGEYMREPAQRYRSLLLREGLESGIADRPQVFASTSDWGTNLTIRYLVGAREKRAWKSQLVVRLGEELRLPEHAGRILTVYPRQQIQIVGADGTPVQDAPMMKG